MAPPVQHIKIKTTRLAEPGYLPPEWPSALLPEIRAEVDRGATKIVVLDDDPTGTQTVHGIPVLTTWSPEVLAAELRADTRAFYILTNSRSLPAGRACELAREIGANLSAAAASAGVCLEIISRSDSTLRGHFPDEVDAMAKAMETPGLPYLVVPCFFEGGRYTLDNIHYVAEGQWLIPAGETAYARDAAFGYRHSNLRAWVEEKTGGRIARDRVLAISLENIRTGGPQRVEQILADLPNGSACVVNAVGYRDLEVFVRGLLAAEARGCRYLIRSAASFVRVRAGLDARALLTRDDLASGSGRSDTGGLFVVGSYVPKTTRQIGHLQRQPDIGAIEVKVHHLLDDDRQAEEIQRVSLRMNQWIEDSRNVLIYTSRELVKGNSASNSLGIGRRVSDSLMEIVRRLVVQPRYLVAKGGITSSDMATIGLGVRRATVLGQILPGVPVWQLGAETRYPGMAYIVFPGNVGDEDALSIIRNRLENAAGAADAPLPPAGAPC